MVWRALVAPHSLRRILWCVVSSLMEPCRYDMGCCRPLCPYGHSGRRAVRWAALWSFLAMQEEGDENLEGFKERFQERIVEQTVDVPVPQVATTIPEVVENISQERIWCMFEELQVAAKILEVIKVPQIDDFLMPRDATTSPSDSDGIEDHGSPDQSSDHARRVPTDLKHRQVCRSTCGVAATGSSYSDGEQTVDQPGDQTCFIPADTVHRQGYCRYACGDAATGPSFSDGEQTAGYPGDQACRTLADTVHSTRLLSTCVW